MWPRSFAAISQAAWAAADAWSVVQVELHGQYSPERMRRFHEYTMSTSWARILCWCIFTPIPCLLTIILPDFLPLEKPSAGREANYVFWVRGTLALVYVTAALFMQIGFLVPGLGMTYRHLSWIASVVAVGCVSYDYILAGWIPMPIPFMFLTATPVFSTTCTVMFGIFFGKKLRNNIAVRKSSMRAMGVMSLQFSLTFIYPIFIYGFNSIPSKYQTPYMIFVPVIKITAKNIMSKLVISHDMRPEILVFCIDAFHSVYVSLAMQTATTISTSLFVMLIDLAQACVSVYDVYQAFQPLKRFMKRIPVSHPLHGKDFLEVAIALDQRGLLRSLRDLRGRQDKYASMNQMAGSKTYRSVKVRPAMLSNGFVNTLPSAGELHEIGSDKDRERFLLCTRKLLFTTEFVILTEYSEVIMPIFFSLFTACTYHLPNRAFYLTLRNIGDHELWPIVTSVLTYAGFELLSLVAIEFVLRCITGVSAMRQVGFVLDTQCVKVQSKLFSWATYAVQNTLEHAGADFSFQFKWLRTKKVP